jgi:hypothetical protein
MDEILAFQAPFAQCRFLTSEQRGLLVAVGYEVGQGWLFGRPVPAGKLPWSMEGPIP